MRYWIFKDSQIVGPLAREELASEGLAPDSLVCPEGADGSRESDWRSVTDVSELRDLAAAGAAAARGAEGVLELDENFPNLREAVGLAPDQFLDLSGSPVRSFEAGGAREEFDRPAGQFGGFAGLGDPEDLLDPAVLQNEALEAERRWTDDLRGKVDSLRRQIERYERERNGLLDRLSQKDRLVEEQDGRIRVLEERITRLSESLEASMARRPTEPSREGMRPSPSEGERRIQGSLESGPPPESVVELPTEPSREGMRPSPSEGECRIQGSLESGPPPESVGERPAPDVRVEAVRLQGSLESGPLPEPSGGPVGGPADGGADVPPATEMPSLASSVASGRPFTPPDPSTKTPSTPLESPGFRELTISELAPEPLQGASMELSLQPVPSGRQEPGEQRQPGWPSQPEPVAPEMVPSWQGHPENVTEPSREGMCPSDDARKYRAQDPLESAPPPGAVGERTATHTREDAARLQGSLESGPPQSPQPSWTASAGSPASGTRFLKRAIAPLGAVLLCLAAGWFLLPRAPKGLLALLNMLDKHEDLSESEDGVTGGNSRISGVARRSAQPDGSAVHPETGQSAPSRHIGTGLQEARPTASKSPDSAGRDYIPDVSPRAVELVKRYPLGGGRRDIVSWLQYSFLAPGMQEDWSANAKEANVYFVRYRLLSGGRPAENASGPITYLFEADLSRGSVQGINPAAKQLLASGAPARPASRAQYGGKKGRRAPPRGKIARRGKPRSRAKSRLVPLLPLPESPPAEPVPAESGPATDVNEF